MQTFSWILLLWAFVACAELPFTNHTLLAKSTWFHKSATMWILFMPIRMAGRLVKLIDALL